jgi:histidine ammonia-lyase
MLAMALCEVGSISERRTAVLVDPKMSGCRPSWSGQRRQFRLHDRAGDGAALVSENKSLAFPASVDSIPTSRQQEDHVSMATHGAMKTRRIAEMRPGVIGIELLAAAQASISTHRSRPAPVSMPRSRKSGATCLIMRADRYLADDLAWAKSAVLEGLLSADVEAELFQPSSPPPFGLSLSVPVRATPQRRRRARPFLW